MSAGLCFALICAVIAVIYGAAMTRWILSLPSGNEKMQEIAQAIQVGASAYLNRQYSMIAGVGLVLALLIGAFLGKLMAIGAVRECGEVTLISPEEVPDDALIMPIAIENMTRTPSLSPPSDLPRSRCQAPTAPTTSAVVR